MRVHFIDFHQISPLLILLLATVLGIFLRVQHLSQLEDSYLLGPDSYRHLRHSRQILESGGLPQTDTMRHVPLGIDNTTRPVVLPWMLALSFKGLKRILPELTLSHVAIFYPVITSAFIFPIFFLLSQALFDRMTALFATIALTTLPGFLHRTSAGFVDHDTISILLFLLSVFLYIKAGQKRAFYGKLVYATLSGTLMGLLGLIWFGVGVFIGIFVLTHLILLLLNQISKEQLWTFCSWATTILFLLLVPTRLYYYHLTEPYALLTFGSLCLFLFVAVVSDRLARIPGIVKTLTWNRRLSLELSVSLYVTLCTLTVLTLTGKTSWIKNLIIWVLYPFGGDPVMRKVAELQPPYWYDWWNWYGMFFILSIVGVSLLFRRIGVEGRISRVISLLCLPFLLCGIVLSRLSPNTMLNGESLLSNLLLCSSFALLFLWTFFLFFNICRRFPGRSDTVSTINLLNLLVLMWFIIGVVLTHSAVRFNLILAPVTALVGGFCLTKIYRKFLPDEGENRLQEFLLFCAILAWQFLICRLDILHVRTQLIITLFITFLLFGVIIQSFLTSRYGKFWPFRLTGTLVIIVLLVLMPFVGIYGVGFTQKSYAAAHRIRSVYDPRIGDAIKWLRHNTPSNSVIAAQWSIGSIINEVGRRSTIIDEEQDVRWIHLMAKHVYCNQNEKEALQFLKTHSATHILLTEMDILTLESIADTASSSALDDVKVIPLSLQDDSSTNKISLSVVSPRAADIKGERTDSSPPNESKLIRISVPFEWDAGAPFVTIPPRATFASEISEESVGSFWIHELVWGDRQWYFPQGSGNGCLWLTGHLGFRRYDLNFAVYLSSQARNSLACRLFLGNQGENFKLMYDSRQTTRYRGPRVKIWEIRYPAEIEIDQKYL